MEGKHTPIHLRPHAPVAERVLAPGDPGRALRLAQALIEGPKMLNHHRGLWGYSGPAKGDGLPLTIQSTGLGGPSAAAVVADLAALGARRVVRVGTCRAVDREPAIGSLVVAATVLATAGTPLAPDPALTAALREELPTAPAVTLASVDFAHAGAPPHAQVRDMASGGLLEAAARAGVRAAAVLVVVSAGGERLDDDSLHAAEAELGRAGVAALGG